MAVLFVKVVLVRRREVRLVSLLRRAMIFMRTLTVIFISTSFLIGLVGLIARCFEAALFRLADFRRTLMVP
jgi:hypothetical protein